jgi:hypothetical protein
MSDAEEFRKQAHDARQMAAQSGKQEDKDFWLKLTEDWLKLAQSADEREAKRNSARPNFIC